MLAVVAIAMLFFIVTCSAVGVRLLWLAVRTGETPELWCGLGFTSIGLIGYPASLLSGNGVATVGEMGLSAYCVGMLFTNAGIAAFYVFTWRVFRPTAVVGAFVAAACALLAIGSLGAIRAVLQADPSLPSLQVTARWNQVLQVASMAGFSWTSVEGLLQARMARRRAALGLADPVTATRLWLWSTFGGSTMLLSLVFAISQLLGRASAEDPFVHVATAVLGGLSSAAIYLAFFPPAAYTRWVRA